VNNELIMGRYALGNLKHKGRYKQYLRSMLGVKSIDSIIVTNAIL